MIMNSRWPARVVRLGVIPGAAVALLLLAGTAPAAITWTLQQPPLPGAGLDPSASGVSCSSPSACVAVAGDSAESYTEVWDGTSWTTVAIPNADLSALNAVSCTSPTACTAVGSLDSPPGTGQPLALRWDGTSWTAQPVPVPAGVLPNSYLTGVSCTSATHCVAVSQDDYIEVWSNGRWKGSILGAVLHGVSCASGTFCVAYTGGDQVEMWNGSTWTAGTVPIPSAATFAAFYSVSCGSAASCTMIGYYRISPSTKQLPLAVHWDGTSWSLQSFPAIRGSLNLVGVSCARPGTACTAAGNLDPRLGPPGEVVVYHWNGTTWWRDQGVIMPPNSRSNGLTAVSCRTPFTCVAIGSSEAKTGSAITLVAEHES